MEEACRVLPSFAALRWPGYETLVLADKIGGEDVVIQLWKGHCQRFFGLDNFPGGIGAEVGISSCPKTRSSTDQAALRW
jgi:hypothetical protein